MNPMRDRRVFYWMTIAGVDVVLGLSSFRLSLGFELKRDVRVGGQALVETRNNRYVFEPSQLVLKSPTRRRLSPLPAEQNSLGSISSR